jgi:glucokinase
MDVVLALDIGGTNLRLVIYDLAGNELGRITVPTQGGNYHASFLAMRAAARELAVGHTVVSIGVGIAGAIVRGAITGSGNLPDWIGHDYQRELENEFGVPAIVFNDGAAAALGEFSVFKEPLIYVIWGTGVGVSVAYSSSFVRPTELGHMVIAKNSRLVCGCGGRGHLEALVSGKNIPNRFKRLWLFKGPRAEQLNDHQWRAVLRDMAIGLRNLSAGDIGLPIVLGGGVACKQAARLAELQSLVNELTSTCPAPELRLARLGEDAGLVGAALAARQLIPA